MAKVSDGPNHSNAPATSRKPCPICGKPSVASEKPFCSKRCADVDLYRWLGGGYAIPGPPAEEEHPAAEKPDNDDD